MNNRIPATLFAALLAVLPAALFPAPRVFAQGAAGAEAPIAVVHPDEATAGEPLAAVFAAPPSVVVERAALFDRDGKQLLSVAVFPFGADSRGMPLRAALMAVPSTVAPGAAFVRFSAKDGAAVAEAPLRITPRSFGEETIDLDQANTALRTVPDPKKTAEAETLWRILSTGNPDALHAFSPFASPVDSSRRTGHFGDRRVYRYANGNTERWIHAGIDFGIPTGSPVRACAPGRVVFAGERIVTGNTVIIEHLPGVFSLYYHLDRVSVTAGTAVEGLSPIGLSGATGLATGPHLHWEVRVGGEAADPDMLLRRSILDKEAVLGKIERSAANTAARP